jgi:hypothetical protein
MEADATEMAQPEPSKLDDSIRPSAFTRKYNLSLSPHRGLIPSAVCVASGKRPKCRGLRE